MHILRSCTSPTAIAVTVYVCPQTVSGSVVGKGDIHRSKCSERLYEYHRFCKGLYSSMNTTLGKIINQIQVKSAIFSCIIQYVAIIYSSWP